MLTQLVLMAALSQTYADRIYNQEPLTGAPLTTLATWAQARWPQIAPANIQVLRCWRATQGGVVGAQCNAVTKQSRTAAQIMAHYEARELASLPEPADIAADGSSALVQLAWPHIFVSGADLTPLLNVVNTVLGMPTNGLRRVVIRAQSGGGYGIEGLGRYERTAAQWLLCLRDGTCAGIAE